MYASSEYVEMPHHDVCILPCCTLKDQKNFVSLLSKEKHKTDKRKQSVEKGIYVHWSFRILGNLTR